MYDAVLEAGGFGNAVSQEEKPEQKGGLMSRLIDIVSGLFTPVLGVLAATGMIKGLTGMLAALGILSTASGTYQLLYIIGDSMFYFLPMYLGFTAAKKFKLNEFVGMTIGACLVYPSLTAIMAGEPLFKVMEGTILQSPVHLKFLGLPVLLMRYSSSVIPVIIAVYFAARLQNRIKKILPDVVKGFLTPCITLLIGHISGDWACSDLDEPDCGCGYDGDLRFEPDGGRLSSGRNVAASGHVRASLGNGACRLK